MAGQGYGQRLPSVAHNGFIVFARSARDLARVGKGFRRSHACKGTGRCRNGEMARGGGIPFRAMEVCRRGVFPAGRAIPPPCPRKCHHDPCSMRSYCKSRHKRGVADNRKQGGGRTVLSQKSGRGEQILGKNVRGKGAGGGVERAGGGLDLTSSAARSKSPRTGLAPTREPVFTVDTLFAEDRSIVGTVCARSMHETAGLVDCRRVGGVVERPFQNAMLPGSTREIPRTHGYPFAIPFVVPSCPPHIPFVSYSLVFPSYYLQGGGESI